MRKHIDIVIWDSEADRLHAIERNLRVAMRNLGLFGGLSCQSEPPLLGRMGLTGRVPVLEIDGLYWSRGHGRVFSPHECEELLARIMREDIPSPDQL